MDYGKKLVVLRNISGLLQWEVAESVGVPRWMIGTWENNDSLPTAEQVAKIEGLFGVSLDDARLNSLVADVTAALAK